MKLNEPEMQKKEHNFWQWEERANFYFDISKMDWSHMWAGVGDVEVMFHTSIAKMSVAIILKSYVREEDRLCGIFHFTLVDRYTN